MIWKQSQTKAAAADEKNSFGFRDMKFVRIFDKNVQQIFGWCWPLKNLT